jgi:WD40 repeat protein
LEEHREEHHDSVTDLAFSSDGKFLASASNDGTCQVWSVDKRTRQLIVTGDKPAGLAAVAFSPDGERFLTAGLSGVAKLWNTRSGRQVLALRGRTETQLTAAVFPPVVQTGGHKQVAIAAADGTVRVYELNEKLLTNDARDLLANYQKR